jgi:hypothetical protein
VVGISDVAQNMAKLPFFYCSICFSYGIGRRMRHKTKIANGRPDLLSPAVLESVLLHDTLQRLLMLTGKVRNPCHFGFRHFISVDAAFANPILMHTHHYPMCGFVILIEEVLEDMDDEVHRRVIVIEQQYTIKIRPLRLRRRPGGHVGPRRIAAFALAIG